MARLERIPVSLYGAPLSSGRTGAFFNAHPYPTKIEPEAIALLIACHTKPGDTIFDGFGGTGTTALATLMCSRPSDALRKRAATLGLRPTWGPRNAVVYELTGLGSFIGQTLSLKVDPEVFRARAQRILKEVEERFGWLYRCADDRGGVGEIRHIIWSDILLCKKCGARNSLWDVSVTLQPAQIANSFRCRKCRLEQTTTDADRATAATFDDVLEKSRTSRLRRMARVYGVAGKRTWVREPGRDDLKLLARIHEEPIPSSFPVMPVRWGDLYRRGYHEGITHVHHFYTRRNLIALAAIRERIEHESGPLRQALEFWLSSYNVSHSTIMTRVVAKQGEDDLVVTSNQPGVLYVSGLPVEKNVFRGLRRKIGTISRAFAEALPLQGVVSILQASSTCVKLPTDSVDYVFTDPPFGGNIPYSEVNFLAEAWLNRPTRTEEEAIISPAQGKDVGTYEGLLSTCFKEIRRILKPSGLATVVFHSTQASVWRALTQAFAAADLEVEQSSILDKQQGSFKQTTTTNFAMGDALLVLRPRREVRRPVIRRQADVVRQVVKKAMLSADATERVSHRLYSRFVTTHIQRNSTPPIDADEFYDLLHDQFMKHGELYLPE